MRQFEAVVIGGSAGSFQVVVDILSSLPPSFRLPIIVCLHRLRYVRGGFAEALSIKSKIPVVEPFDKDKIERGTVYVVPANYHLYIEDDKTISLSTEEPINHSRPSIDITFHSAAQVYKSHLLGIILSGANSDGAMGLQTISEKGGTALIQDPREAEVDTMPKLAISFNLEANIFSSSQIIDYLKNLG